MYPKIILGVAFLAGLAFVLTGEDRCADDGPAVSLSEQNGLALHLIVPRPYQVKGGQLKVQAVLKNVSKQPIRAVTRLGQGRGASADWSSISLNSFFKSDAPRDEDIIRSMATMPPGEGLALPIDCPIPKARPYRMEVRAC